MMNMVSGSLEVYLEGLAPSITPPCEGALFPPVDAGTNDVVAVATNELASVVDMTARLTSEGLKKGPRKMRE